MNKKILRDTVIFIVLVILSGW